MYRVVFLTILLTYAALPSAAAVPPSVKDITDGGCVADMSTSGCFSDPTPTGYTFIPYEPTVTACKATGSQRCKYCKPIYTANGALYATECGYTSEDSSCTCSLKTRSTGCNLSGSCDYTGDL